jgi:DNA-binding transcriptional MocR family regulator
MWSIKQVASSLQMSTQAIYKQKEELISKGYMEKNNNGNWEITDTGFNYLQDKKIAYMQQHTTNNVQPVANQPIKEEVKEEKEEPTNFDISTNDKVANLLLNHYKEQLQTVTNQLQEMTEQRNYFKAKFEEKDNLCNQYMNSHLLPPTENEAREKQEKPKQSIFKRLFSKGE